MAPKRDVAIGLALVPLAAAVYLLVADPSTAMGYSLLIVGVSSVFVGHGIGESEAASDVPKAPAKWLGFALAGLGIGTALLGDFSFAVEAALRMAGNLGLGITIFGLADAPECVPDEDGAIEEDPQVV